MNETNGVPSKERVCGADLFYYSASYEGGGGERPPRPRIDAECVWSRGRVKEVGRVERWRAPPLASGA